MTRVIGMVAGVAACGPSVTFECAQYECIEPAPLSLGDPDAGWAAMRDGGYVTCGIPLSLFREYGGSLSDKPSLEGRSGDSAGLPYDFVVGTSIRGVKIVNNGCFDCHAAPIDGELVLGAGNHAASSNNGLAIIGIALQLTDDPAEIAELEAVELVLEATHPLDLDTRGVSTGNFKMMAVAAHRDPLTNAWLEEPHMEPPTEGVPYDVPPWWNTRYKAGLFANTAARGDSVQFAMNPSHVCTEDAAANDEVASYAADIAAWIHQVEPPPWPWDLDDALAREGRDVFEATCARCHGTYRGKVDYPSVVVPIAAVGTDPWAAEEAGTWQRAWDEHFQYNAFGDGTIWAPQEGYIAPPLTGLWASAPYFHNGSVPTLAGVTNSADRPTVWRRLSLDGTEYDQERVGWRVEELDVAKDDVEDEEERFEIYDTTRKGYHNTGHTFGDALDATDRAALLAYLRTL